nr:esterase B1-like [Onthophagus taurus]
MVTVQIEQGKLRGKVCKDFLGGEFFSFEGIPYAKPPIGPLRFKAPQPPLPWDGIRDATKEGDPCYSLHMINANTVGSEDCLFLNVHTPKIPENFDHLKPVMVWIHGGGFLSGSGNRELYGPEFLIPQDVVVVTINYRLGALGFLYLNDPKLGVPGNAGLKDQVMALKWIKNNIKNFGGDPDNVTIFGESAGGASVHYLILSPMARGLFHKAIPQSGCALNPWAWGSYSAKDLCNILKKETNNEEEILKVLQNVSVEHLFKAQFKLKDHIRADDFRPLGPIIEKISPYEEAFLSEPPLDLILQGRYNQVPIMMGYTSREGMLIDLIIPDEDKKIIQDFEDTVPVWLGLEKKSPISIATGQKIKQFYFGDKGQSLQDKDPWYMLNTDNLFLRGIYTCAKHHSVTSKEPVYLYRFSFDGPMNLFKTFAGITSKGAAHGDDLCYLFKNFSHNEIDRLSIDCECISKITQLWGNFAKTGNPNLPGLGENVEWKPVTKDAVNFLDIDFKLTLGENPEKERMEFWDGIYKMKPTCSKL